jgi:hypothetical protein
MQKAAIPAIVANAPSTMPTTATAGLHALPRATRDRATIPVTTAAIPNTIPNSSQLVISPMTPRITETISSQCRLVARKSLERDVVAGFGASRLMQTNVAAQLTAAAAQHHRGRTQAQNLRTAALSATGAGELAALKNLRAHLAGMRQLLAEHAGQDAAAAARIRALDYRR